MNLGIKSGLSLALIPLLFAPSVFADTESDAETVAKEARGAEVTRICFANGIDGFRNAEANSVVLSNGRRDFLVTTRNSCRDLASSVAIGIDSFGGCVRSGDKLIAFDSLTHSKRANASSCIIDEMFEWGSQSSEAEGAL